MSAAYSTIRYETTPDLVATITLDVADAGPLVLSVFDVLGRRVSVLHAGYLAAGAHAFGWEAPAAGVYLVRAVGNGGVATARVSVHR